MRFDWRRVVIFAPVAVILGLFTAYSSGRAVGLWHVLAVMIPVLVFMASFIAIQMSPRWKRPMPSLPAWRWALIIVVLLLGALFVWLSQKGTFHRVPSWLVLLVLLGGGSLYAFLQRRRPTK